MRISELWDRARVRWGVCVGLLLLAGSGCSDRSTPPLGAVAVDRVARGPVALDRFATVPQAALAPSAGAIAPAVGFDLPVDASVDARLLVITADGTDPAYTTIADALRYLGTPFDTFNAKLEPDLTAERLATGNRGHYYGVILDRGNLSIGDASAFSPAEWAVLGDYEARFKIRRAALYAYPEAAYGLVPAGAVDTTLAPLAIHCTDCGVAVFAEASCGAGIPVSRAWAYPATAIDATTVPILVDDAGRIFGAISTDAANRQSLALTFAQAPSLLHSLSLINDVIRWVTRGVFLGERHVYLTSQIDDLFLASNIYPYCGAACGDAGAAALGQGGAILPVDGGTADGLTYRITDHDLQALADWQTGARLNVLTADLRLDWALNGSGYSPSDPLSIRALALGPSFKWISHTWDHPGFDSISYADALVELARNDTLVASLGLAPYDVRNLVTPAISGLNNPEALRAARDAGVRFLIGDTSVAGWNNPSPNAGIYSPYQSELLVIPRRPTNLFYNVSTPDKWQAEYNDIYRAYWGRDLSYDEILGVEADVLLRDLLRGANDPWMFHQANARDYGGGRSLLSDLHDRVIAKYAAVCKLPVVSPTMEALGGRVAMRMAYDRSQAAAVVGPGAQLTVRVVNAAVVPVTGLCTPSAESYAGRKIAYLDLAAGTEVTLSLDGCNDGSGAGGGAGGSGAGGSGADDAADGGGLGSGGAGGAADSAVDPDAAAGSGGASDASEATRTGEVKGADAAAGQQGATQESPAGGCGCSLAKSSPVADLLGVVFAVVASVISRRRRTSS